MVDQAPPLKFQAKRKPGFRILRPVFIFASGLAAAAIILLLLLPTREIPVISHRFVIYKPNASQVEITGSFTGWNNLAMKKLGNSGYWEIKLDLPQGEHRFSYILEDGQRIPDPTILIREKDDFGGENSILELNVRA